DALELARKLYDDVIKARNYDKADIDVERLGRAFEERYHDFRLPEAQRKRLFDEFEVYARDLATRAHTAAKDGKQKEAYLTAAQAYANYLDFFYAAKARPDMEENRAEALLAAEQQYPTGNAFEKVATNTSNPERKKQALINAISGYQAAL